jgi:hypothetical protein
MHTMGMICALTLSVLSGGFCMDWDTALGPVPLTFLNNHPFAVLEAVFVADAIAACISSSTMLICTSDKLICILPLGVAFNSW